MISVPRKRFCHLSGFSLVELLIVAGLIVVLVVVTAPAFGDLIHRQRLEAASDTLQGGIALARVEAVRRGQRVEVRPLACGRGDWNCGWAVAVTGETAAIRVVEGNPAVMLERLAGSGPFVVGPRAAPAMIRFRFSAGPSDRPIEHYLCHSPAGGFLSTRTLAECDSL